MGLVYTMYSSMNIFFILSFVLSYVSSESDCPPNWIDAADKCYLFENSQRLSWMDAQQYCQNLGGHLAETLTEDWSNLLTSIANIETEILGVQSWWLGLTDLGHEGRWIWPNALVETNFTNWAEGYPMDGGVENNCVSMKAEYDLKWSDEPCTGVTAALICQTDYMPTTTAPGVIVVDGPFGGDGGSAFSDEWPFRWNGDITAFTIGSGAFMDHISFTYGNTSGPVHGRGSEDNETFELNSGSHIVAVQGSAGDQLNELEFTFDDGSVSSIYGAGSGTPFASYIPGCYLAYISGRAGQGIDSVNFHWQC